MEQQRAFIVSYNSERFFPTDNDKRPTQRIDAPFRVRLRAAL